MSIPVFTSFEGIRFAPQSLYGVNDRPVDNTEFMRYFVITFWGSRERKFLEDDLTERG